MAELIPKYLDPELVQVVQGAIPETTKVRHLFIQSNEHNTVSFLQVLELRWDHSEFLGLRICIAADLGVSSFLHR